jgi:hypothetical protein
MKYSTIETRRERKYDKCEGRKQQLPCLSTYSQEAWGEDEALVPKETS